MHHHLYIRQQSQQRYHRMTFHQVFLVDLCFRLITEFLHYACLKMMGYSKWQENLVVLVNLTISAPNSLIQQYPELHSLLHLFLTKHSREPPILFHLSIHLSSYAEYHIDYAYCACMCDVLRTVEKTEFPLNKCFQRLCWTLEPLGLFKFINTGHESTSVKNSKSTNSPSCCHWTIIDAIDIVSRPPLHLGGG